MPATSLAAFVNLARLCRVAALAGLLLFLCGASGCVSNTVLRDRAEKSMQQGDFASAERGLDTALNQDSTDWKALRMLGALKIKQGQYDRAIWPLRQALTLNYNGAETPAIVDDLAEASHRAKDHDSLRKTLDQACKDYSQVRDFLRQAHYLRLIGDHDGAELALRKAERVANADDARPYLAMADFYESVGQPQKAEMALKNAYYLRPHDPDLARRLQAKGVDPQSPAAMVKPTRGQ